MTVNAGDIIRVTFNMVGPSAQVAQNVYHYIASAGVSDSDNNAITAIRDTLDAAHTALNTFVSSNWTYADYTFSKSTDGGATFDDFGNTPSLATDPSSVDDPFPSGAAPVVLFNGSGTGRQGRKFLAGFRETAAADDVLNGAAVAALANYAANVVVQRAVAGGTLNPGWLRRNPLGFTQYTGTFGVNTIVGYQRRRKPGVGI